MKRAELANIRSILVKLLRDAEQPFRRREEIAVENAPDALDRVQGAEARELAIRRIESDTHRLQSLRMALERVDDGTYGSCMRCDEPIGAKRLAAIPWAAHCVRCQDVVDQRRRYFVGEALLSSR